jgi:hypothetical protein
MTAVAVVIAVVVLEMPLIRNPPGSSREVHQSTAIIQIDPVHTLAINQGPLMDGIIFRKREHLSERQRVVRTLKKMASMGPIARVCTGSIRTQLSIPSIAAETHSEIPRRYALSG